MNSPSGMVRKRWTLSWGAWFFLFIIGGDIIGVWIAQLLPAIQAKREVGRRAQCVQNLKQIGLAVQGYHQKYGCFPPSFIPDKDGKPQHSWRVLILPFLEEQDLYAKYHLDEPWNSPHNMVLLDQMPAVYRCPSDYPSDSQTSYAMVVGPHAVSDGPTAHRIDDIKDKGANTIMVAEAANAKLLWLEPRDLDTQTMVLCINVVSGDLRQDACEIFSYHSNMANVLFCDGTVRDVNNDMGEKVLKAMLTID